VLANGFNIYNHVGLLLHL